jgi:hypothetical protein
MKEAGLDLSCYYHIRDFHVSYETFSRIMSPGGTAFMTRWWNRAPQYDGLFDFEDAMRPAYFSFKLLARLQGERLRLVSTHPAVHGFLAHDGRLGLHDLILWNYSGTPVQIDLVLEGLPKDMKVRAVALDAAAAGAGEDSRLRHLPVVEWKKDAGRIPVDLEPWAVRSWSME